MEFYDGITVTYRRQVEANDIQLGPLRRLPDDLVDRAEPAIENGPWEAHLDEAALLAGESHWASLIIWCPIHSTTWGTTALPSPPAGTFEAEVDPSDPGEE